MGGFVVFDMEEVGCFAKIYIFLFSFCTGQKPCLGKNQSNNMFFFSCNTHFLWCHFLKDVGTYRKKYNSCIYIQQRIFLLKTENSFLKRHPTIKQNIVLAFDIKCDYKSTTSQNCSILIQEDICLNTMCWK